MRYGTCFLCGRVVMVMGEISTQHYVDIPGIARRVLKDIGYDGPRAGFDGNSCAVMVAIDEQSPDIAMGTNDEVGGAGDQGMMFGFACDETPDLMPLPITLANKMAYKLSQCRKVGTLPYILPDGKTQVTVEYSEDGRPIRIDTIVISTQHVPAVTQEEIEAPLVENVIRPVLLAAKAHLPELDRPAAGCAEVGRVNTNGDCPFPRKGGGDGSREKEETHNGR